MTQTEPLLTRVGAAIGIGTDGDRAAARDQLAALWEDAVGDPVSRCTIAHHLADLQESTEAELAWDLRALDAVGELTDERLAHVQENLRVRALLPSLHLNLADDYRRLSRQEPALKHLAAARRDLDELAQDAYGDLVRGGLDRVAAALAAGSTERLVSNPSTPRPADPSA